jgi:TorA maturation chaperone TorD
MSASNLVLTPELEEAQSADLAREAVYRFLSLAFNTFGSPARAALANRSNLRLVGDAILRLRESAEAGQSLAQGELDPTELDPRPLVSVLETSPETLEADYFRTFGFTMCRECPPFETEYCANQDTFFRSQEMADVAGFYRAHGLEFAGRPDDAALEFEFMALLITKRRLAEAEPEGRLAEAALVCGDTERAFFRDHLAWWLPSFAAGLRHRSPTGFYRHVADLLSRFVPMERARFDVPPPPLPVLPILSAGKDEEPASCVGEVVVGTGA